MKKCSNNASETDDIRRYREALKLAAVSEIDEGKLSVGVAIGFYDIPWRRTISRWQSKYGKVRKMTRVVRVLMKSEQERIRALEKALADKELELLAARALASVYETDYGED